MTTVNQNNIFFFETNKKLQFCLRKSIFNVVDLPSCISKTKNFCVKSLCYYPIFFLFLYTFFWKKRNDFMFHEEKMIYLLIWKSKQELRNNHLGIGKIVPTHLLRWWNFGVAFNKSHTLNDHCATPQTIILWTKLFFHNDIRHICWNYMWEILNWCLWRLYSQWILYTQSFWRSLLR